MKSMMRRTVSFPGIFVGCCFVVFGFFLPWYTDGLFSSDSAPTTISGLDLWLASPSARLLYAPGIVPAFFGLLWIVPCTGILIGMLALLELIWLRWNHRWFFLGGYSALLILLGFFLVPALLHATVQFGLWICAAGWFFLFLGVMTGFGLREPGNTTTHAVDSSSPPSARRTVLHALMGVAGLAALGSTGSFLLWATRRTHTSVTTYRYSDPTGRISSGGAPDFNVVLTVDWSADGQHLLVAQLHAPPQSWNVFSGGQRTTYQPAEATAATWSPDGRLMALSQNTFTERPFLLVVNPMTNVQVAALTAETSPMHGIARFAWSPDSQYLALGEVDTLSVKLWKPTTPAFVQSYTVASENLPGFNRLQDVAWSPDGRYLAATVPEEGMEANGTRFSGGGLTTVGLAGVYVWHAESGVLRFHQQAEIPPNSQGGSLLIWSPNGQFLAFAHQTTVQILAFVSQRLVLTYRGHALIPTCLAWSPDGHYLASGSVDWTVQVWEAASGEQRFLYQGHAGAVRDVAWSPDGKYIASCGNDGTAQVWSPGL